MEREDCEDLDEAEEADDEELVVEEVECLGEIMSADVEPEAEFEVGIELMTTIFGCRNRPHLKK